MNPRLVCVWCGSQQSWKSRQKFRHIDHILDCLHRFKYVQRNQHRRLQHQRQQQPSSPIATESESFAFPPSLPSTLQPTLLNLQTKDPKLVPFDHDISHLPPRAHDFPCLATLEAYPISFQDDALNLAFSCVQLHLENPNYTWFHVSICIPAYARFLKEVEANQDSILILPFSCWCDAGKDDDTRFRQHRHMILGCTHPDDTHFLNNIWLKIKVLKRNKPESHYKALYYTSIQDAMHFVNTILYTSRRLSQCKFSGKEKRQRNNHFYLSQSLSKKCSLPLSLLWNNGIYEKLYLDCKNLNRNMLVQSRHLHLVNSKYRMKIKHIPDLPLQTVLPVDRVFEPCNYPTRFKLHLMY